MARNIQNVPANLEIYDNKSGSECLTYKFVLNHEHKKVAVTSYSRDWSMIGKGITPRKGLTKALKYAADNYNKKFSNFKDLNKRHETFISGRALKSVYTDYQTDFWCNAYHSVLLDNKNEPVGFMTTWCNPETKLWNTFITQSIFPNAKHAFFEHEGYDVNSSKGGFINSIKFKDEEYKLMIDKIG